MKDFKVFSLRIPNELYTELKELATRENRSLNSQVNYIIKAYIQNLKSKGKHQGKQPNRPWQVR